VFHALASQPRRDLVLRLLAVGQLAAPLDVLSKLSAALTTEAGSGRS
jgi:hypothetical protein